MKSAQTYTAVIKVENNASDGDLSSKILSSLSFSIRQYNEEWSKHDLTTLNDSTLLEVSPIKHKWYSGLLRKVIGHIPKLSGDHYNLDTINYSICEGTHSIRTKENHGIALYQNGRWILDPDGSIPEALLVYFSLALKSGSARFNTDGTNLINAAKNIQARFI